MENRPSVPKFILILLGVVLLAGAIAAASSFSGVTANPVSAQPPDAALGQDVVVPVTEPGSGLDSLEKQSSPSGSGCNHDSEIDPSDF